MPKYYTVYARNLYALASTLVHLRIPFSFRPHNMYKDNKRKSPFGRSTIDFEMDSEHITISNILYEMHEKYGSTFDFEIISES